MIQPRLFTPAPDVVQAHATWTYQGWTYQVHHRTSGEASFRQEDRLIVAELSTEELLDVVCATWCDRLQIEQF
jgi:hypothetical protein